MKLSKYIKKTLKEMDGTISFSINFDVGIDTDMTVNNKSKNRVSFMVVSNE